MRTNGITPETFADAECQWKTRKIAVVELRRNPCGDWTLEIDLDAIAVLPDGRKVRFVGDVRIRGRQSGRKNAKVVAS